ncbi:hypothetical protein Glove_139g119 [Diversispora epigaea]|uniref:Ion transport domain-containing protein n=1 Tax=Diversispora epigaea TaxID=1348612 RepID=A0A397IVW2_9GLOM|nr:hypothetical protein Glove_139g119 [Diversispora epigaea]
MSIKNQKIYSNSNQNTDFFEETGSLKSFTEKDFLLFGIYIAISPDSQQIVTFSQESQELKLYSVNDLSNPISEFECRVNVKNLCWSIAISNLVDDNENERLIALSCFDTREFRNDIMRGDDENNLETGNTQYGGGDEFDLESGGCGFKVNKLFGDNNSEVKSIDEYLIPQTWVISSKDGSEISTPLEEIGGIIRFIDGDDDDNRPVLVIANTSGIYKETMNSIRKKHSFFSRSSKMKKFELPQQLLIRLSRDHWHSSLELIHTSIIKNHFMVHSFKNRQQIIEMYSLITGDLEMLFKRHESPVAPNMIHGSPIFAISQNEKILAFCRGTTSITLYFMENGLEITTKQFEGKRGIYKIVAINFIDDDSKLLIVLEEYQQVEILKHQIFVVWDLFTTYENSIRQIDYSETLNPLKMDVTHRLMNSHGKMFAQRDNGDIFSVLDHPDVASIRNPTVKALTKINFTTEDKVYHAIYNINGERSDTNQIIINDVEPWHPNKNYCRISVYLDSTKRTQLIISHNTIQVWKYCNSAIEKCDKDDRILEYIWARKKAMEIQELRIGEREFILKVSIPSTKCPTPKTMTIHWPNNVNVLEGACRALYVLGEKKHFVAGLENVNQIEYLDGWAQKLVRKHATKSGIFRLTCIRYPIMKYLIKSYQEGLIKHILNKKVNNKNRNIYIPRLYKWTDENNSSAIEISESDLHHAILCIQKNGDSTVVLKNLIDYYTDNAKDYNNPGWLFTLSKAIPLLYDYNLREFIQDLFKKPCFGITEAYTPPLHINSREQRKGNNAAVIHSLVVKPCLDSKNPLKSFFRNQSENYQEGLIKHILNKKVNNKNRNIYIPRLYKWTDENNSSAIEISESDLHHAILCIQKNGDSTVVLKNLIDYYTDNAKDYNNPGWLFTLSKAIPLLYDYNLREFIQDLFKKPCFGITEAYTPPLHINSREQRKGNNAAVIHSLVVKPCLDSKNPLKSFFRNQSEKIEKVKTSHSDRKVYMVPLPDFTTYPNSRDSELHGLKDNCENSSKIFWFLLILFRISLWPRRKVINSTKKMSPFLRVIHEEDRYEIYQTPSIMAVSAFKWSAARRHFIRHIFMYLLYTISYTITVISYSFNGEPGLVSFFETKSSIILNSSLLVYLYTGWYLIVTEFMQLKRNGWIRYLNTYNLCDLGAVLLPLLNNITSFLYGHGKISLQNSLFNPILAFTALFMWLEVLLLLRYFEGPGRYIYIIQSILKTIWPFFAFMLIAILAFGHAMFILLNYAGDLQITTYKVKDDLNPDLYSNITIYQDVDKSSRLDNHYGNFISSIEAVFFWTNGRWDQLDQWDNYAVDVVSILGSIVLVLIFQNMLIAFMNGAFDEANKKSRTAAHRYRAELIAEYEVLEKPFGSRRGNPRFIYYIPDPDMIDIWLKETKKDEEQKLRLMGENITESTDSDYCDDCDDDDDDSDYDDNDHGSSSTVSSIESIPTKYFNKIDKITFTDEEIFDSKVTFSKFNKKSQRNLKSHCKLLKNNNVVDDNNINTNYKSSDKDQPDTTCVNDRSLIQDKFNLETRLKELEQSLRTIMATLNK